MCGVGHPIVKCEGSSCSTVQGMHGEAGKSSERLVSARQGGDEVTSTRGRCDQGACRKEREGARETKKEEVEEERTTQDEEEKGTQVAEEARAAEAQEALNIFFHKIALVSSGDLPKDTVQGCVDMTHNTLHILTPSTQSTCALATDRDRVVTTISLFGSRKASFHTRGCSLGTRFSFSLLFVLCVQHGVRAGTRMSSWSTRRFFPSQKNPGPYSRAGGQSVACKGAGR